MPPVPVLKAGLRKKRMSSIGSSTCSSQHDEDGEHDGGDGERDERGWAAPAVLGRLDQAVHERDDADDREQRADRVELALLGVAATSARGTSRRRARSPGSARSRGIPTRTRSGRAASRWRRDRCAPAAPVTLAQMAMALVRSSGGKTLTRIDRVEGMMNAAPTPISARQAMSCHMAVDSVARTHAQQEHGQAELQRALAPEAVAERAGREQQPGEDERVGGDDPLELRRSTRRAPATASGWRR